MNLRKSTLFASTLVILVAIAANVWLVNRSVSVAAQETVRRATEPLWVAKFDQNPLVAMLPDGKVMGVSMRTIGNLQTIMARYSKDNGHSWSEEEPLFKLSKDPGGWAGPQPLVDRDGEVHLFLLNDAHTGIIETGEEARPKVGAMGTPRLDLWHMKSTNGRTRWQAPKRIWEGYTGSMNSVIQLRNGRILLPFSFLTKRTWSNRGGGLDDFTFMGQYDCTVVYSDDAGDTWRLSPAKVKVVVPDIVSAYGAVEPVVLEMKDGRVWMLIRAQTGRFYESFSKDGAVWSRPRPTQIINSDSPAGLVRLKDGRIMLFWNACLRYPYAYGGRQVLHAAISEDEGQTWRGYREVVRDPFRNEPPPPGGDFGTAYPFPILVNDGKVIISTGQGKGRSFLVLIDPAWLYETQQKTSFSAGIDDWSVFGTRGVELVSNPITVGRQLLSIRKTDADWPAAAVWNFPMGRTGRLRVKVMLNPGFAGARLGLTDHFSVPFDPEDQIYNLFNLEIGPNGELAGGKKLEPGNWHDLVFDWDSVRGECRITVDGRPIAALRLTRETAAGVCYLRLVSTAEETDKAGLLVESVDADVSESWRK